MKQRVTRSIRDIAIVVVIALVLSVIFRLFVFQVFYVPSSSMKPTFLVSDRILVSKIDKGLRGIRRGDIVVFKDPGGWISNQYEGVSKNFLQKTLLFVGIIPSDAGEHLVKRVIGIPGDHVMCCSASGKILVNDRELDESELLDSDVRTDQRVFDVHVQKGYYFVMGDNRGNSADSRFHLSLHDGQIPYSHIVGRVVARIWPIDRFSFIFRPDAYKF